MFALRSQHFEMPVSREKVRPEWQQAREARHFESGLVQAHPHRMADLEKLQAY
jgi:hypothetical protein